MRFAILGAALLLSACSEPNYADCRSDSCRQQVALYRGETVLIRTAPDGTKLWATQGVYGRLIYFSTGGAQYDESHGKTTETVIVPNSN